MFDYNLMGSRHEKTSVKFSFIYLYKRFSGD